MAPPKKLTPIPEPPQPRLTKTFGQMDIGEHPSILIRYKDFKIAVNLKQSHPETRLLDYFFLTNLSPGFLDSGVMQALRKDQKIFIPPESSAVFSKAGFSQVKEMKNGNKILLKKGDGFLFASALENSALTKPSGLNGFFLEFDSGRNIFLGGENVNTGDLREFVYSLRDDGKEIHLAVLMIQGGPSGTLVGADSQKAAEIIGLLQPRETVLIPPGSTPGHSFNEVALQANLKDQFYDGQYFFPTVGATLDF